MELYGRQSKSIPQKVIIVALELALLYVSFRLLFGDWGQVAARWLGWTAPADGTRRWTVLAFNGVVFVRMTFMMVVLLRRHIPFWEAFSVPLAFATYYVGFALFVLRTTAPPNVLTWIGVALFVLGSLLNTVGEVQRYRWKRRPENEGHLFTGGLFSLSRHINYTGDVLWVAGYALVTGNPWSAIVPVALFCFFAFFNAPQLDRHLAEHYGAEYEAWAKKTKMLIPSLY